MNLIQDPLFFTLMAGLLGLCVGSFLNVVIHRLPKMLEREWHAQCAELRGEPLPDTQVFNLAVPRSRCPNCGHLIRALENIPVLSYLMQMGRCKGCAAPISLRYPTVELFTALASAWLAAHFGFGLAAAGALLFLWVLVALTGIDFDTQLLPDNLTLPLLWLGLVFNLSGTFVSLNDAVIGAMSGYLLLWTIYWAFRLATGKEGMGYGDFKLLGALGAWLGWKMLPVIVMLSSVVGATVGISLVIFARRGRHIPIPFGPYLAAAGLIAMVWGKPLTQLWLGVPA